MYESEVNGATEAINSLPPEIRKCFAEFRGRMAARTTLPWGEHCTECVWPVCYSTCELYSPREDGACRQFVGGVTRIDHKEGASPYVTKIQFKQWAKLWTVGNISLESPARAVRKELANIVIGAIGRSVPLPVSAKTRVLKKISYLRRRAAETAEAGLDLPDYFLVECYNPNEETMSLTLTVRQSAPQGGRPFQTLIDLPIGYTRATVAIGRIAECVDLALPFEVELVPNHCANKVLYFGLMEFVREKRPVEETLAPSPGVGRCKCVVWDLDNTLWDGVLIEDGETGIRIRRHVIDVIARLDERGILHSIASKNNHDDVIRVLRQFRIEHYFLHPQVTWAPKSQSIARIAQSLNIGLDSLAFVDDQAFERQEVMAALPEVLVIGADECTAMPERPEFDATATEESRNRRAMYFEQESRATALAAYGGDYMAFLRECRLEAGIGSMNEGNLTRVYELAQRTNQLNFSGNRYPKDQLADIMRSSALKTYVIDCADRFGQYGIVGFAMVDLRETRLLDLMFSCRVQGKRVEHAVLAHLLREHTLGGRRRFYANFRPTTKNAPAARVFDEIGFERAGEQDGTLSLVFSSGRQIPDDRIVTIKAAIDFGTVSDGTPRPRPEAAEYSV